jgi:hypothetical protein
MLENELSKLAGENWQVCPPSSLTSLYICNINAIPICVLQTVLEIAPTTASNSTSGQAPIASLRSKHARVPSADSSSQPSTEATQAHLEQVRLLILGMEQRLSTREESLKKVVERAEGESGRFDELNQALLASKV